MQKVKVTRFKIQSGNGRTDGRTEAIALRPMLTLSINVGLTTGKKLKKSICLEKKLRTILLIH